VNDPKTIPRRYLSAPHLALEGPVDVRTLLPTPHLTIEIEIGPGRGGFLLERVTRGEDVGLVAFEIKRKWATIVNERLGRAGLAGRARVFADDARAALARLQPSGAVAAFFFHFPDPWWKKKHQKRRLITAALLDDVARLLCSDGELFIQTDVEERALLYETQIAAHPCFEARGDQIGSARLAENPYGARSHRERRALADALPVHRLHFVRKHREG